MALLLHNMPSAAVSINAFVVLHTQALMSSGDEGIVQRLNDTKASILIEAWRISGCTTNNACRLLGRLTTMLLLPCGVCCRLKALLRFPGFCQPPKPQRQLRLRPGSASVRGLALQ